jgi:hypothetical protein
MRWSERGLAGFGSTPLIRELDHERLAAVLRFLDASAYLPMLEKKLIGPPLRLPAPSIPVEKDLQLLQQFASEDTARRAEASATQVGAPAVLRRYQELFGARLNPATLTAQPLGDLLPLFDAASLAANDNPASSALDDMLRLHHEFTTRGIDTRRTLDFAVLYALLAARRFEEAGAFAAIRPNLADEPIPKVIDALGAGFKGRSVFAYDETRNTLTRIALPSAPDTELVIVVGAGCHNAANALQAIHDDVALQARLREVHLVLITPPNAPIETHLISEWNAANPTMPIRAPYNAQEWQSIEVTGIPAFYLLRSGKVVDQKTGWPTDGKAELIKLIGAAAK